MSEYLNRVQVVCGCWLLSSWKKESEKSLNYEVVGEVTVKSHWQEPLARASRVFTDFTPFVSGGE